MIHKKASIKIGNYLKNAVGNAKIFVTNRFTSMLPTGGGNLISSFVDIGLNKVSNSQAKVAAQILKKSPFEIPDSPEQAIKSDPMAFSHIQYPADLTGDELGHYMLFFTLNNNMDWDLASVQQDLQFSADLGIDTKPIIDQIKVEEPPKRKAGIKVANVEELVQKLKNEAKVI
mgnify:CR=1 FL=1